MSTSTSLHTPLCDLLGCDYPLILAGMGGVARSALVAAVSEAGGFGFLGMVREPVALIREEVARVREQTGRRFGINLIPAATPGDLLEQQLALCIELQVGAVALFWDLRPDIVARLGEAGILAVCQVGSAAEARLAQQAGADVLIVQGVEAGGHVRGRQPLDRVLDEVLDIASVPVAAAGGIVSGRDVDRVLARGAQAAVLGTALVATQESFAHDYHKQRLVEAQGDVTVLTEAFHINWPPRAAVRVLPNSVTRGERGNPATSQRTVIGEEAGRPVYLFSTDSPLQSMTGDFEAMALYAGTGVGRIAAVEPAAQRIQRIIDEVLVSRLNNDTLAGAEPSSPVCYAGEAEHHPAPMSVEQTFMVLARLGELLEAERAGALVALQSLRQLQQSGDPGAPKAALQDLLKAIHHDESRWCAMLARQMRRLGAVPNTRIGAFADKALAIADLPERMRFLNRGQGWVVRKLRELLEVVEEPALQADLTAMLEAHRDNIEQVNALFAEPEAAPSAQ